MTNPELKTLNMQIEEAQKKVEILKKSLKSKSKELDEKIKSDSLDLFGERKSEATNQGFLFSERVSVSEREKVLQPLKTSLKTAENELTKLTHLKANFNRVETTGKLF